MKKYLVRGFLAGFCLLWITLGIIMLQSDIIMGILLLLNGACFGVFTFVCKTRIKMVRWLFYIFIVANTILTVTDQMGIIDWIVLILYIILIGLLIIENKKYNLTLILNCNRNFYKLGILMVKTFQYIFSSIRDNQVFY